MSTSAASTLHADLDAFYASVEQRDDPALCGRPVAVGGGVVLACSYEAKRRGVRTAMGERAARALCPDLTVVRPRFDAYLAASRAVFELFRATTPAVRAVSIDEAFLDVGGLSRCDARAPAQIAAGLRAEVREQVGLPISVGVARTPFLAKMASRAAKPDGLLLVEPADEAAFLFPMPIAGLWGVGESTAARAGRFGLRVAGDLADVDEPTLQGALGRATGARLFAAVHGRSTGPVEPAAHRVSIGAQRALGRGPHRPDAVRAALLGLVDRVTRRLRGAGRTARTLTLRLRFGDYSRATRSRTLRRPSDSGAYLAEVALGLLAVSAAAVDRLGLTLVGVTLSDLAGAEAVQGLLDLPAPERHELDRAQDAIGRRFGHAALTRASLLHRGEGFAAPLPEPESG